jgi:hypothetical protein
MKRVQVQFPRKDRSNLHWVALALFPILVLAADPRKAKRPVSRTGSTPSIRRSIAAIPR